jgi:hypothetical protein
MFRRNKQVHVSENSTSRLIQYEISQGFIVRDEGTLFPDRVSRWRRNASHDYITDFTFSVYTDDMY